MRIKYVRPRPAACDRARELAALRPDGGVSELERALLESHLAKCPPCAAFAGDVALVTVAIRNAPLERLDAPIAIPQRRRVLTRGIQSASAVAAVVALAFGALGLASDPQSRRNAAPPAADPISELEREAERAELAAQRVLLRPEDSAAPDVALPL